MIDNLKFYDLLLKNIECKSKLGELILLSGKLETVLAKLLKNNGVNLNKEVQTLNTIIKKLYEKSIINENMKISLELLANQRNYIAHCIFGELDNFFEEDNLRIDKSNKPRVALPTEDLVEEDVLTYSEYFNETVENLIFIIEIFEEKLSKV
jgi:hypothetical protein